MITPAQLRTAIIMMRRAPLTGEEAADAASAIQALEATYEAMTAPKLPVEEPEDIDEDGDD